MEKEIWTEPEITEIDVATETQLDPTGSGDNVDIGGIPGTGS